MDGLFLYSVANYYILDRFRFGLDKLGIDYETRRLTVHCLWYTYNTRMRTLLSEQVLREFVGHWSIAMTDHYNNPILTERLAAIFRIISGDGYFFRASIIPIMRQYMKKIKIGSERLVWRMWFPKFWGAMSR